MKVIMPCSEADVASGETENEKDKEMWAVSE